MGDHVLLTAKPLDPGRLRAWVMGEERGAVVEFSGIVRRSEEGRRLRAIDYEIYEEMAEGTLHGLLEEAHRRWGEFDAVVAHRNGVVEVGACAVYIAVSSVHRERAFQVCRWLIDELKQRAPVWKREFLPADPLGGT